MTLNVNINNRFMLYGAVMIISTELCVPSGSDEIDSFSAIV